MPNLHMQGHCHYVALVYIINYNYKYINILIILTLLISYININNLILLKLCLNIKMSAIKNNRHGWQSWKQIY